MYITEKLLKSFLKDVSDTLEACSASRGSCVGRYCSNKGIDVSLFGSNGYTVKEADILAKKAEKSWLSYRSLLAKYKGYFEEDENRRSARVGGEGEYDCDYAMELQVYFNFGDKLTKYDGTKYFKIREILYRHLREYTKDTRFLIQDKGSFCTIGDYFKYDYTLGTVTPIGRVVPSRFELDQISITTWELLRCLSDMPFPINSVWIDGRTPNYKDLYFYSVGKECILWSDIEKSGIFWRLLED